VMLNLAFATSIWEYCLCPSILRDDPVLIFSLHFLALNYVNDLMVKEFHDFIDDPLRTSFMSFDHLFTWLLVKNQYLIELWLTLVILL